MPKERENNLPGAAGKNPTPKIAENREKMSKMPQIAKKTADPTAIERNLKLLSVVNLCLKFSIIFSKIGIPLSHCVCH